MTNPTNQQNKQERNNIMCEFGDETHIINELDLSESKALIGWRNNYLTNPFNDKEKFLKSLNQSYIWPKKEPAIGKPKRNNSEGIYNYNYYNNYNYNNYNYYYYNYYYNSNYNNYNYNNYYYYHNYYCYYNIQIKTRFWGKVFSYKEGYRSKFCKPVAFVILDKNSEWFTDQKTKSFAENFNNLIEQLTTEYGCEVIEWSNR